MTSEDEAPNVDSIESQISNYDSEKSVLKFKTWVSTRKKNLTVNVVRFIL